MREGTRMKGDKRGGDPGVVFFLQSGMSFGLARGRELSDAGIGVGAAELPPLPDAVMTDPEAGRLDPRRWFAHPERAFEVEIGCGKGGFLLQEAGANAGVNYLGIEYAREFYLYAADRMRRRQLSNVRMVCTDAGDFLRWRCPGGIVRVIHLYFSDPWPKTKHHKNRVIQDRFLAEAWRALVPGGELRVVTDHDELWAWDEQHFARWTTDGGELPAELRAKFGLPGRPFEQLPFVAPQWAEEGETVGTNYERKMCGERPPHACVLKKV
jgi:tRNA (guanine-N7-)-methyltransferase